MHMGKQKNLLSAGGNANQYSHCGNLCGSFVKGYTYFYCKFYCSAPGHSLKRFNILLPWDLK